LGIEEDTETFDCIQWHEEIIPHGWSTVAFRGGAALGTYIQSGKTALAQTGIGRGRVFSFGFQYGHSYSRRTIPIVPPQYGKRETHPIVLLRETPVAALAGEAPLLPMLPIKVWHQRYQGPAGLGASAVSTGLAGGPLGDITRGYLLKINLPCWITQFPAKKPRAGKNPRP
jgi:hypothetical protein